MASKSATDPDDDSTTNETADDQTTAPDVGHLEDVPDGCGCVEVWEHTSTDR